LDYSKTKTECILQLLHLPLKSEIFYNLIKIDDKEKEKDSILNEKEKLEVFDDTNNSDLSKNNEENEEGKLYLFIIRKLN
jgi:hypothetical protein